MFEDLLLELGQSAVEYKGASNFLLKLAGFLPASQLAEEYLSAYIFCTKFLYHILKKVLVLPRMLEDVESKSYRISTADRHHEQALPGLLFLPSIFFEILSGSSGLSGGPTGVGEGERWAGYVR